MFVSPGQESSSYIQGSPWSVSEIPSAYSHDNMQSPEEPLNPPRGSSATNSCNPSPSLHPYYGYPHGEVVDPFYSVSEHASQGHYHMLGNGFVHGSCDCGTAAPQPQFHAPNVAFAPRHWEGHAPSQPAPVHIQQQHGMARLQMPMQSPSMPGTPGLTYANGAMPVPDSNYVLAHHMGVAQPMGYQMPAQTNHATLNYSVNHMALPGPPIFSPVNTSFTSTTTTYPNSQSTSFSEHMPEPSYCVSAPMPDGSGPARSSHSTPIPRDGILRGPSSIGHPKKRASTTKKTPKKASKPSPKGFLDAANKTTPKATTTTAGSKAKKTKTSPKTSPTTTPETSASLSRHDVKTSFSQDTSLAGPKDSPLLSPMAVKAESEDPQESLDSLAKIQYLESKLESLEKDVLRVNSDTDLFKLKREVMESSASREGSFTGIPTRVNMLNGAGSRRPSAVSIATTATSASSRRSSDADTVYSASQAEWSIAT